MRRCFKAVCLNDECGGLLFGLLLWSRFSTRLERTWRDTVNADGYEQVDSVSDPSLRLQEISTLLIQEGNLDSLYQRVLDAGIDLMSADMGSMQKYCPAESELRLLAFRGFDRDAAASWERIYPHSATSCAVALSVGSRVIISDIDTSAFLTSEAARDALRQAGIRAAQST